MKLVSGRALGMLVDGGRSVGVAQEELTRGLPGVEAVLENPRAQLSWDDLTTVIDRLAAAAGGPEALRSIAEAHVATDSLRIFQIVGRALSDPRDLYYMGARWMGPSLFPMIDVEMTELVGGRLLQTLTIQPGYRDCAGFFHMVHGSLVAAPKAWGHELSVVTLRMTPRSGRYLIQPRAGQTGVIGRLIRTFRLRLALPSIMRELEQQQNTIGQSYQTIESAYDRIAAQASDLARVNTIGQELSKHIELDRVADVLLRILLEDLGFQAAELWLIRNVLESGEETPSSNQPRFFRRAGEIEGEPAGRHELEAAGRAVGQLRVWREAPDELESGSGSAGASESDALLERLLPWISIALDNARAYEALEQYASDLEQRVRERTARLLAANHHLVREIDERRRTTEALLQSESQLRASERLASIGTLAAGIAHEINNPVGSILAASQLAQVVGGDANADEEIRRALEDIECQAKRCGEIVRSVLQFSRDEQTEKWDCNLSEILMRSVRLTAAYAEEQNAHIRLDVPARGEDGPWAHVNPIQIEQAVVNLLRNAIESGGEQIDLSLAQRSDESTAVIEIRDDGEGISNRDQLRIFEPFFTTKRDVGGTGLGLSVVHGIAAEHGGTLRVETERETGSCVVLELPIVSTPSPAAGPEGGIERTQPAERAR